MSPTAHEIRESSLVGDIQTQVISQVIFIAPGPIFSNLFVKRSTPSRNVQATSPVLTPRQLRA